MTATSLAENHNFRGRPHLQIVVCFFISVPDLIFLLHAATHQNNVNTEIIFRFGVYLNRMNLCLAEVENTFNIIT